MAGKVSMGGRARALFRTLIVHGRARWFLGGLFAKLQAIFIQPSILPYFITFFPHKRSSYSYVVRKSPPRQIGSDLPCPPERLWYAYGPTINDYLQSGKRDVDRMRAILTDSGFSFEAGKRIMEFGCAAGRMLRWFNDVADRCELWGTDISGDHIVWCKQHLRPPFNFFITTTNPHLPFEDNYFDLIYAGSVFSHIDDMADTWLLELRRILKPGGRLYITVCDNDTLRINSTDNSDLSRTLACYQNFYENNDYDMFTIARFVRSIVFYDKTYLSNLVAPIYNVVSITPEAYGSQSGVLLSKR
jgi:ubiquinone/menaquinone biosynthesis C-methylase UbiE